jgi:hypothetical protein
VAVIGLSLYILPTGASAAELHNANNDKRVWRLQSGCGNAQGYVNSPQQRYQGKNMPYEIETFAPFV